MTTTAITPTKNVLNDSDGHTVDNYGHSNDVRRDILYAVSVHVC